MKQKNDEGLPPGWHAQGARPVYEESEALDGGPLFTLHSATGFWLGQIHHQPGAGWMLGAGSYTPELAEVLAKWPVMRGHGPRDGNKVAGLLEESGFSATKRREHGE